MKAANRALLLLSLVAGMAMLTAACATVGPTGPSSIYGPPYSTTDQRVYQCEETGPNGVGQFHDEPGWREIIIDNTLVEYYLPQAPAGRSPAPPEILVLIHGAGFCHFDGAVEGIHDWRHWADERNFILIAPAFDRRYATMNLVANGGVAQSKRYVGCPCAGALSAQCQQYARHAEHGRFPWGYRKPDDFLWSFIFLVVPHSHERTDRQLDRIVQLFRAHYQIADPRFSIFGYSGGGQFIARYFMLHPENLKRVALGGSGSFLFPSDDHKFPYGMSGAVGDERFSDAEWDAKLRAALDLPVLIFAGGKDFVGAGEHPDSAWQGTGQLEIARNFVRAMQRADKRLKAAGRRPAAAPFRCEFISFYGRDHGEAYRDSVNWLQENWLGHRANPLELLYGDPFKVVKPPADGGTSPKH